MSQQANNNGMLYRAIFEQAAVGIARVVSATGRVVEINQMYCDILGYTMEEMAQRTLFDLTHPDDLQACRHNSLRLHSGEITQLTTEQRYCRKDGSIAWVRLTSSPMGRSGDEPLTHIAIVKEITEHKRLNDILKFKNFSIDTIAEAIHWTRMDGSFWDCNAAACAMLGYSREELLALSNRDIDPHYSDAERQANLAELIRTGKVRQRRFHAAKDGRLIPVEITSSHFRYNNQEFICSIVDDISDRVKAEKEAAFYRALVECSRDPIYVVDPSDGGRMVYANSAACTHFGVAPETLRTMRIVDWDSVFDMKKLPAMMEELRQGKAMHFETMHRDPSGRQIPVEVTSNIMEYDGKELLYGYFFDISERRAMEAALHESRRNLIAAQRIAHMGNCVTTVSGRFISASEEYARILGVPLSDFPKSFETYLEFVHPADRKKLRSTAESTQRNHGSHSVEYRIIRPDGDERIVQARAEIVPDGLGNPDRVVATAQDVTEQKRAEAERLDLEKSLQHARKLESLGVMAGGIAHDFNNLLTAIIGNLQLLRMDLPQPVPGRARIDQAEFACRRAANLTNQILVYSGKGMFRLTPLDLGGIVKESAELFRAAAPRTISLEVDTRDGLPLIMADPDQIRQVIMSLLTNAAEAIGTSPGKVTLTAGVEECDADCIRKSCLDTKPLPGRFCYVEVADNGCGMDADTQSRSFDPFFTTKFTGRGLGLAAAQGIVQSHHGVILLESEEGRGTTFRILFPVQHEGKA